VAHSVAQNRSRAVYTSEQKRKVKIVKNANWNVTSGEIGYL